MKTRSCEFFVPGTPQPKGSTRSFLHAKTGRLVTISANDKIAAWQERVKLVALHNWKGTPSKKPIEMRLVFWRKRPRSHFGTGRNASTLKANAPVCPAFLPDLDKLVRGMFDAMTGVVYVDDKQVCHEDSSKNYGPNPGVVVSVREMPML